MMRGTTLVELLVTLAILGLLAALSGVSVAGLRPPTAAGPARALDSARAAAIRAGRIIRFAGDSGYRAVLLPDGRVVGPGRDPLTGERLDARR